MSSVTHHIDIIEDFNADGVTWQVVGLAARVRNVSMAWLMPLRGMIMLDNFNRQEELKGSILRRFDWDLHPLLLNNPGQGVLIRAFVCQDMRTYSDAVILGVGPTPAAVLEKNNPASSWSHNTYFWITATIG